MAQLLTTYTPPNPLSLVQIFCKERNGDDEIIIIVWFDYRTERPSTENIYHPTPSPMFKSSSVKKEMVMMRLPIMV